MFVINFWSYNTALKTPQNYKRNYIFLVVNTAKFGKKVSVNTCYLTLTQTGRGVIQSNNHLQIFPSLQHVTYYGLDLTGRHEHSDKFQLLSLP